jgi:hypothetical protein
VTVPPGGEADVPVVARAAAGATQGEDYGFIVFRNGDVTRRVPYLFLVDRPALATAPVLTLKRQQSGDTRIGTDRVDEYRFPVAPFGNAPDTPPMVEDGAETLYETLINRPAVNAGVSVVSETPGAQIDPFYLGAADESTVQGFAGTPVNVNALTSGYLLPVGAAGASFPRQQRFFVAVDSGREPFTSRRLAGHYVLRSWVNDVTPPTIELLTTRVAAGRPTLVLRVRDTQAGVDPASLTIGYQGALIGAAVYDPTDGIAVFPLPNAAPKLAGGTRELRIVAADFQEAKNIETVGPSITPNTRSIRVNLRVVAGTTVTWITPAAGACLSKQQELTVAVSSSHPVTGVRFLLDGRKLAAGHRADELWDTTASTAKATPGRHTLVAVTNTGTSARRIVRTCKR